MPTPEELHTQIQYRLVEQLAESERKYRQLLENLTEIVFEIDQTGSLQFLNPAWTRVLGYCEKTSLNQPFHTFLAGQNYTQTAQLIQKLSHQPVQCELQLYNAQGQIIWMELLSQPTHSGGAAGTLNDITQRKDAVNQLQYQAEHDVLTGVMNRAAFMKSLQVRLQVCQATHTNFAVLFIDLDRFKIINDSYGHLIGDLLLKEVSQRLKSCVRAGDLIARFGGDEFNILLDSIQNQPEVLSVVSRIQSSLRQPFIIQGNEIVCDSSLGIWFSDEKTRTDPSLSSEKILKYADTALYLTKGRGRGNYAIFNHNMQIQLQERLELEQQLRIAIDERTLELYYQPIVSFDNAQVLGFEALLRWKHPTRGLIPPNKFISIAEESGLIAPLGWLVLEEACHQRAKWQRQFPNQKDIFISVNFSSRQFLQSNLAQKIHTILKKFEISPDQIKLEITETCLMENVDLASQNLKQLEQLGIKISIDDFGTGYSSLSYLHQFPISTLKIDRSFLANHGEVHKLSAIVDTIINLAHKLEMAVVAEGVEVASQAAALRSLGCEMGQGYYFGKPQPAEAILDINCAPLIHDQMAV